MIPILLASTSAGRRELLARLGLPFECRRPDYGEPAMPGVAPAELARQHALGKALSVAPEQRDQIVIGSDQVASLAGRILGKPGSAAAAEQQLRDMAGRWTDFHTGIAVLRGAEQRVRVETFRVRLRSLTRTQIEHYVALEKPLQCAGSFRVEGLGIALMQQLEGADQSSLIGLPLLALCECLGELGIDVLAEASAAAQLQR